MAWEWNKYKIEFELDYQPLQQTKVYEGGEEKMFMKKVKRKGFLRERWKEVCKEGEEKKFVKKKVKKKDL